jgi:hypothetical protein
MERVTDRRVDDATCWHAYVGARPIAPVRSGARFENDVQAERAEVAGVTGRTSPCSVAGSASHALGRVTAAPLRRLPRTPPRPVCRRRRGRSLPTGRR